MKKAPRKANGRRRELTSSWSSKEKEQHGRFIREKRRTKSLHRTIPLHVQLYRYLYMHSHAFSPSSCLSFKKRKKREKKLSVRKPFIERQGKDKRRLDGVNTSSTRRENVEKHSRRGKKKTADERKKDTHRQREFLSEDLLSHGRKRPSKERKEEGSTCLSLSL